MKKLESTATLDFVDRTGQYEFSERTKRQAVQRQRTTANHSSQHTTFRYEGRMLYFNREELNAWLSKNPVKTSRTHEQDAIKYVMDNPLKL